MIDDDPVVKRLCEAVWADPANDAPRMVLADVLLQRNDPLGEMIAVQLHRARTGDAITQHEIDLVSEHGLRIIGPVAIWLAGWRLERGFLYAATVRDESFPPEAAQHPAWATVERLVIGRADHPVLASPHLRLQTLQFGYRVGDQLAERTTPLPCVALTGTDRTVGLSLQPEAFDHRGAFDHVRTICLADAYFNPTLVSRRLFGQLDYLALTFHSPGASELRTWRSWAAANGLARFSVRLPLNDDLTESVGSYNPSTFIYVETELRSDRVILQLDDTTYQDDAISAANVIAMLAGERTDLLVEDLRGSNRCLERHGPFIERLRTRYPDLVVATGPVRVRMP